MNNIINIDNTIDYTKIPVFFGSKGMSLQRYDKFKYPGFFELFKQQINSFWLPEEIDISKDRLDFKSLTENEKFIFTSNLSYQILLDSIQSRGIPNLTEHLSNLEVEAFCSAWSFFETIHSYSYTYIIKNIYHTPGEIFDNILTDNEILKRTSSVTKYYNDLIDSIGDSEYEKKKKLYLTLMSINILEGIRFYVSFACSYAFAQNGKMEGNAKIITLINKDENLHLGFTQKILRDLKNKPDEEFQSIVNELEPIVIKMFKDAANEEMDWADYLFKNGSMLGLNSDILKKYMMYLTNTRMKSIGLEPIFEKTSNPINWINAWTNSESVQPMPQETEVESYNKASIDSNLNETDFSDYDFNQ